MIESFISTWPLFQDAYLVGWLIAALLSLMGILLIAREQIFIGAAISQASTLGIAFCIWFSGIYALEWILNDSVLYLIAGLFAVIAALLTTFTQEQNHEALTGWVFLASASFSILLAAHNPRGLEEVQRLLSSSLIGANRIDVYLFTGLACITVLFSLKYLSLLLFITLDPISARAQGIKVNFWNVLLTGWVGIIVGLAMKVTGLIYAFGCLILPGLIAIQFSKNLNQVVYFTPIIALSLSISGFVIANYYDYPPAQVTIALYSMGLVLAKMITGLSGRLAPLR